MSSLAYHFSGVTALIGLVLGLQAAGSFIGHLEMLPRTRPSQRPFLMMALQIDIVTIALGWTMVIAGGNGLVMAGGR